MKRSAASLVFWSGITLATFGCGSSFDHGHRRSRGRRQRRQLRSRWRCSRQRWRRGRDRGDRRRERRHRRGSGRKRRSCRGRRWPRGWRGRHVVHRRGRGGWRRRPRRGSVAAAQVARAERGRRRWRCASAGGGAGRRSRRCARRSRRCAGGAGGGAADPVVMRGDYLVNKVLGCPGCHTPSVAGGTTPDMARFLAGKDCFVKNGCDCLSSANLTNDDTGLKMLTDQQIKDAFTKGKDPDQAGAYLFATMPYYQFSALSDDDATAIVAYLRRVPARAQRAGGQHRHLRHSADRATKRGRRAGGPAERDRYRCGQRQVHGHPHLRDLSHHRRHGGGRDAEAHRRHEGVPGGQARQRHDADPDGPDVQPHAGCDRHHGVDGGRHPHGHQDGQRQDGTRPSAGCGRSRA